MSSDRSPTASSITSYDDIGAAYLRAQKEFYNPRNDWARDWIRSQLPGSGVVMDLGCGDGADLRFMQERGLTAYGVEKSRVMFDAALANGISSDAIKHLDMNELIWHVSPKSLDHVSARYSMHYVDHLTPVVHGVHAVLKTAGTWSFVVPNPVTDVPYTDTKDYSNATRVNLRIFNNQVPIHYPFHRLEAYLGQSVLEHFRLESIDSYCEPAFENSTMPTALGIRLRKM